MLTRFVLLSAILLALAVLCGPAHGQKTAKAPEFDYLPANSELVLALRWRAILNSEFGKKHRQAVSDLKRWLDGDQQTSTVTRFLGGLAFDPVRDVDTVWVALPAKGRSTDWVAVVKAGMPPERLGLLLAGVATGGVKLHPGEQEAFFELNLAGANQLFFGFASGQRLLLAGEKDRLRSVLREARRTTRGKQHSVITRFLQTEAGRKHMALITTPDGLGSLLSLSGGDLPGVDGFVHLGDTVHGELRIHASSEKLAKSWGEQIRLLGRLLIQQWARDRAERDPRIQPVVTILDALKLRVEGSSIIIEASVPAEVIVTLARNFGRPR